MEINYYRKTNSQGLAEAWASCQFTSETDLRSLTIEPLVTINGQPFLRQHHVTFLTGKETCRAHHFAKHLAIQVLSQDSCQARPSRCKVLWIDTTNGPHVSATIYRELATHAWDNQDLHFVCLDVLGGQREDFWFINRAIEDLINEHRPDLVVIDDIDHFMPYCGINIATEFSRTVRDAVNHTDTAFLFIGYNHIGKKACSTGNLGKQLFTSANDIFTLSTQRDVTTVRHICGYDLRYDPDECEFRFTIGPDNIPHEAPRDHKDSSTSIVDDDTLREIATDIIQPGQTITPVEFLHQVTARHRHLRQQERATALYNQALRLNILPQPNESTPSTPSSPSSPSSPSTPSSPSSPSSPSTPFSPSAPSAPSSPSVDFNTPLTLPLLLRSRQPGSPYGGSAAV